MPRILFINKLDKDFIDITVLHENLQKKYPLLYLTLPLWGNDNISLNNVYLERSDGLKLCGEIDLLTLDIIITKDSKIDKIKVYDIFSTDTIILYKIAKQRRNLLEKIANLDDDFATVYLEALENIDNITYTDTIQKEYNTISLYEQIKIDEIIKCIKKLTIQNIIIPTLWGISQYGNGVYMLLQSIKNYLPSPKESLSKELQNKYKNIGYIFKIYHDITNKSRGLLTFIRMYNGTLKNRSIVYTGKEYKKQRILRQVQVEGNELYDVDQLDDGMIGAIVGNFISTTGDIVIDTNNYNINDIINILKPPTIPIPVYRCIIYPHKDNEYNILQEGLEILSHDDPSINIIYEDDGTIILQGMGELHLETVLRRLKNELKIDVDITTPTVQLLESTDNELLYNTIIETTNISTNLYPIRAIRQDINIKSQNYNNNNNNWYNGDEKIKWDFTLLKKKNIFDIKILEKYLKKSTERIESCGPKGLPVCGILFDLNDIQFDIDNNDELNSINLNQILQNSQIEQVFISTISNLLFNALKDNIYACILEPITEITLVTPIKYTSNIINDICSRNGSIINIDIDNDNNNSIVAYVPTQQLNKYAAVVRSLSQGNAFFTLQPHHFAPKVGN